MPDLYSNGIYKDLYEKNNYLRAESWRLKALTSRILYFEVKINDLCYRTKL